MTINVLVTRPRAQSAGFGKALQAAGFEPIYFPVIHIRPIDENPGLDRALQNLDRYDWIVFTSINAVEILFKRIAPGSVAAANLKVAAIGPKTAAALQARGVNPDFVPDEYVAESILPGMGDLRGKWVLLPRAEIARKALPRAIAEAGGTPHEIAVYQTLPEVPDTQGLAALRAGVDVITLTSPSTVSNFIAILRRNGLDPFQLPGNPLFACIGPITERAARAAGLVNLVTAGNYTSDGLIEIIRSAASIPEDR